MEMFVFPQQDTLRDKSGDSRWATPEGEYSCDATERCAEEQEGANTSPRGSQGPATPTNNSTCGSARLPRRFSNLVSKTYGADHQDYPAVVKDESLSTPEFRTLNRYQIEYAGNKGDLSITPPTTPKVQSEGFALWKQQYCSTPSAQHARASPAFRARQSLGSPHSLNDPITPPSTSQSSGTSPTALFATSASSHNLADDDKSSSLRRMSRYSIPGNRIGHRRSLSYVSNCSVDDDHSNSSATGGDRSLVFPEDANYTRTVDKAPKSDVDLGVAETARGSITGTRRPTVVYLVDNPTQKSIDLDDISIGTYNNKP